MAFVFSAAGMAFAPSSAFAAPSGEYLQGSAIPPSNSRDGSTYEITSPDQAESINVTFIIEAGDEMFDETGKFWVRHDVLLSQASEYYTITDLLVAVNNNPAYDLTFRDDNGNVITSSTIHVNSVEHDGTTWEGGQLAYDGWAVRVDDRVSVYDDGTGWIAANILQTNIKSGDIVHMFYDFPADYSPESGSFAANYVRGVPVEADSTSLTVQLQGHTTFIYPTYTDPPYYVDNYKNVQAGVNAYLYDSTGTTLLGSAESDVNGRVTFRGTFVPRDVYIVKTDSVYFPAYDDTLIGDDVFFALTGAYSKVEVPVPPKSTK
jgi:hypothetical protein